MSTQTAPTKSMSQCMQELRESMEGIDNSKTQVIGTASIGDVVRQGDLYITCIDSLPEGKITGQRQLAPGNTQGSRHVLKGDVTIVEKAKVAGIPDVLVGPAFKCNGPVTLDHPEHGNFVLPEGTMWAVTYQQAFADEIRRVQD